MSHSALSRVTTAARACLLAVLLLTCAGSFCATATASPFFTIRATNGTNGNINPKGSNIKVDPGASITFTMTPDPGYSVANVVVDGASVGPVSSYTFTNVSADHDIHATFAIRYTLTVSVTGGGSVVKTPNQPNYAPGTVVQLTAAPNAGWSFQGWSGDASGSTNPTSVTMNGNRTVTATFVATSAAPVVTVLAPNGGEQLVVGGGTTVQWSATDDVSVTEVDILLSRSGVGGSYETVASGIGNSGQFAWTVTGPGGTQMVVKVVARDGGGLSGEDVSDGAFAIADTFQTPILEESGASFAAYGGSLPPAWGDYDLDGLVDLPLYHNNGDGTFTETPGLRTLLQAGNYHGASWCDFDRDGDPDLVVLPYEGVELDANAPGSGATGPNSTTNAGSLRFFRNDGIAGFADIAPSLGIDHEGFGETAVWGDFDGDGRPDLFAPYYSHLPPFQSFFFRNSPSGGGGSFTEQAVQRGVALQNVPEEFKPEGAHAVDIDDDGDLDLYCASHLFINNGDGVFTDVRAAAGLPLMFDEGAMFVDYDNDGDFDLNLRTTTGPRLYRNTAGMFSEVTAEAGLPAMPLNWGDSWADVDNDGDLDAYFMMPDFQPGWLMINQGNGTFSRDITVQLTDGSGLSSWADYDRDGDMDLHVEAFGRHMLRNTRDQRPGFAGSYVRVVALDGGGRRTQFGATVRLRRLGGPPSVQTRAVDGGSGYLTQSEYTVHFGADPAGIYALEVTFMAHNGPVVVDSTDSSMLGHISPSALEGQVIFVRRDGTVTLNDLPPSLDVPPEGETARPLFGPATPNPAHGPTMMSFRLASAGDVTLAIHDVAGRVVRRATFGRLGPGDQHWSWDGRDESGRQVPSGVYLSRLMVGGRNVAEQRIVQLR